MIKQRRWRCKDCGRQWAKKIYGSRPGPSLGPEGNCPIDGSPNTELVEFEGFLDIDTPPEVYASQLDRLAQPSVSILEVVAPSQCLLGDVKLEVVESGELYEGFLI